MSITKQKRFIPADGLAGLRENFKKDALSGLLVFLLALPLSLGIAKASQFPMIFGLVTAIVGGVVVSFIMGSRLSIKGPAAGLIVIASGSVDAFGGGEAGWHYALGAVVTAGILQVVFGILKTGRFADFFPSGAIHGMLAAIGVIIMAKQLHLVMGVNPAELSGMSPLRLILELPRSLGHENLNLAVIGLAGLAILIAMSRSKNSIIAKIPAPLVVLCLSVPLGIALDIGHDKETSGYALVKVGSIADAFSSSLLKADFSVIWNFPLAFVKYVILYSFIGSIESLLTAKAVDRMDPYRRKTDYNKDLTSIGIGNVLSGILGGLPMISEVARSSANVGYGARTRWSNFFHGLFMLLAVLAGASIIEMIPNVALSAMLIFVGFRLAHPKQFALTLRIGKEQLIVFCTTLIVTICTDLLIGVASGIVLELIINLVLGASPAGLFKADVEVVDEGGRIMMRARGDILFSNLLGFKKQFAAIPPGRQVTLDLSETTLIDHTSLATIQGMIDDYSETGGTVIMTGLEEHRQLAKHSTSARLRD